MVELFAALAVNTLMMNNYYQAYSITNTLGVFKRKVPNKLFWSNVYFALAGKLIALQPVDTLICVKCLIFSHIIPQ